MYLGLDFFRGVTIGQRPVWLLPPMRQSCIVHYVEALCICIKEGLL